MWVMTVHFGEFGYQLATLNLAGFDGQDLVGLTKAQTKAGKDSSGLPRRDQQLGHPSHFWYGEFGQLVSSMEGSLEHLLNQCGCRDGEGAWTRMMMS